MISQRLVGKLVALEETVITIKPNLDQRGLMGCKKDVACVTLNNCYLPNYGYASKGSIIILMSANAEKMFGKQDAASKHEISYMVVFNPKEEITEPWVTTANIDDFDYNSRNVIPFKQMVVNEKLYIRPKDYLIYDKFPTRKEVYFMPVIVKSNRIPKGMRYILKWTLTGISVLLQTLREDGNWRNIKLVHLTEEKYIELVNSKGVLNFIMDTVISSVYNSLYAKDEGNLLTTKEAESILAKLPIEALTNGFACAKSLQVWYTFNYTPEFSVDLHLVNSLNSYRSLMKEHRPVSLNNVLKIYRLMNNK